MLFNSWEFLCLLLATAALYYLPFRGIPPKLWQVSLLLVSSALFYAWEEPRLLVLLGASCLLNAIGVERILHWKNHGGLGTPEHEVGTRIARRWLCGTVTANLLFLAFFKYAGFLSDLLPSGVLPAAWRNWLSDIPLPVGISFYTFQGISLVVDVWRNEISANTSRILAGRGNARIGALRDASFYIVFFPQLVAGPIVKAHEFVDQIGGKRFRDIDWVTVRRGLVLGYFLKIFVADNLAEQTAYLSSGGTQLAQVSALNNLPLLYGYSFQIFADFAGYSLIAIGLGALFGYRLPANFNFPYLSTSITEFWRRWHLSLSSWLRDYLYIPLGGNRKGAGRTYFNLFLVMFLGGLWHGAAWKFALWGALHGMFLALERLVSRRGAVTRGFDCSKIGHNSKLKFGSQRLCVTARRFISWFITFHLVTFLWLTFMMPDMASIVAFFASLVNGKTGFSGPPIFALLFYGSAAALYHAWGWIKEHRSQWAARLEATPLAEGCLHALLLFLVLTNPGAPRGFIYFQF